MFKITLKKKCKETETSFSKIFRAFWKNFIFTYEISDHESKTFATDFDSSTFGIVLTQHVVSVS